MLTQVRVDNFRGFDHFVMPLARTTVLMGPNGCGKSSLLAALRLACTAVAQVHASEPLQFLCLPERRFIRLYSEPLYEPTMPWLAAAYLEQPHHRGAMSLTIAPQLDGDVFEQLSIEIDRTDDVYIDVITREPLPESWRRAEYVPVELSTLLRAHVPTAVFVPPFHTTKLREEYRSGPAVDRLLLGGEQEQVVRNLVVRLGPRGVARLNRFLSATGVDAEVVAVTPPAQLEETEFLTVDVRDGQGAVVELASAGAGVAGLIAIFASLWRAKTAHDQGPRLYLLDEPDLHLHPRLQAAAVTQLASLAAEVGAQLVCTTHSVAVIERFGRQADTMLVSVDRTQAEAITLTSEPALLSELSKWCDLSPFSSLSLLRNRRILFHEGPSDASVLQRLAELHFAEDAAKLARFSAWAFSTLAGVDNAAAADVLMRALQPLVAGAEEPIRIARILDQDGRREAGLRRDEKQPGFVLLDVVWSLHSIESLFLTEGCLGAWLSAILDGADDAALRALVASALAEADADAQLNRQAAAQLLVARLGLRRDDQAVVHAHREADAAVAREPARFQQGRSRAHFVLGRIRQRLPPAQQNRLRRDVAGLVASRVAPRPGLVPDELARVLDLLTAD